MCFFAERPDFEGGLILRRGCTVEHVVCSLFDDILQLHNCYESHYVFYVCVLSAVMLYFVL